MQNISQSSQEEKRSIDSLKGGDVYWSGDLQGPFGLRNPKHFLPGVKTHNDEHPDIDVAKNRYKKIRRFGRTYTFPVLS